MRYHYCSPPSVVEGGYVRFGPAAPAEGVSRRYNYRREQTTRTYSREGTQTLVLHTNTMTVVKTDGLVVAAAERSMVAVAGTVQTHKTWRTTQERLAQAQ